MTCLGVLGGDGMNEHITKAVAFMLAAVWMNGTSAADPMCVSPEQVQQIRDFYADNAGTTPIRAVRRSSLAL